MSRSTRSFQAEQLPAPVCDYCGCEIEEVDQRCVALPGEEVCSP